MLVAESGRRGRNAAADAPDLELAGPANAGIRTEERSLGGTCLADRRNSRGARLSRQCRQSDATGPLKTGAWKRQSREVPCAGL